MTQLTHETHTKARSLVGRVVSTKMTKTIVVEVVRTRAHPMYKKMVRRSRRFAAHNELPDLNVGDSVRIAEIKPMSKTKHFKVVEKL
ncbi:30S ribosomal protein S17 [Candidatus Gottesmanbacteria bacterium]|nr:30S ribosomal protein S17 [Candidatus Gottesmanbacteria bacterium]